MYTHVYIYMYTAHHVSYPSNHSPAPFHTLRISVLKWVLVQVRYMKVGCFTIFTARSFSPFIPKTSKTCKNRMFLDTPNIQNLYLSWVFILTPTCLFTETRWKRFSVAPRCRKTNDFYKEMIHTWWGCHICGTWLKGI